MRIVVTADPYLPVPPRLYGGIERVIDFLARGLTERGHDVTLFAHPESRTEGRLIAYGAPPHQGFLCRLTELRQVGMGLLRRRREIDVIHSFGRLAALLPLLPNRRIAKVQSYQRAEVPWSGVKKAVALGGTSICFTGCSASVLRERPGKGRTGRWHVIFNGVDLARYDFSPRVVPEAPLVFLGRLEPIKGAHNAIAIARSAGKRLMIAGTRAEDGPHADYFDRAIAPHLDGQIQYVGPVDDAQKNSLLGAAAALLMPIEWDEPFGIVMAEALACGTPVIGFARGSVPEIVRDGVNGFLCLTVEDAVSAVKRLGFLDRAAVRADCKARFSASVIVDAYERLYRAMVRA